jgi:hypothetical protein
MGEASWISLNPKGTPSSQQLFFLSIKDKLIHDPLLIPICDDVEDRFSSHRLGIVENRMDLDLHDWHRRHVGPPKDGVGLVAALLMDGKFLTLTRTHLGDYEIWLHGELIKTWRPKSVGASAASTFSSGDADPISESGLWSSGDGSWGAVKILSGRARASIDNLDSAAYIVSPSMTKQQFAKATVHDALDGNGTRDAGLGLRMLTGTDETAYVCYCRFEQAVFTIFRVSSAFAFTEIGSGAGTPADGNEIEFSVVGSSLKLRKDGVVVRSETDTNITAAGQPGICFFYLDTSNIAEIDGFVCGDYTTTFGRFG